MKKTILLFLFLLSITNIQAQLYDWFQTSTRPCITDSTVQLFQYTHWDIYKTLNDEWDGPLDSTFCGQLDANRYLDLSAFAQDETIFIKYRFDDPIQQSFNLPSNQLFSGNLIGSLLDTVDLNYGNNCADGLCSGVLLGIEIPDSANTGTDMRWYQGNLTEQLWWSDIEAHFCVPSEYFNQNEIKEIIIKLTIDTAGGKISFWDFYVEPNWWGYQIQDSFDVFYDSWLNSYDWYLYDHILVLKSDYTLYPNLAGMEYVDLLPVPNVDTPITMNLYIDMYSSLIFQPFVQFQGGYVLNDSSKRHHYNIINNGGNICFPNWFERIFKNGDNYIHNSGTLDFQGPTSCMEFGSGSKLIVGEGTTFYYGNHGQGALALRTGGSIDLKKGAELIINNRLIFYEYPYEQTPRQLYMELKEGSKLTFGKNASISNDKSRDGTMKLNIYMRGGSIDMSNLDAHSRSLINLIYEPTQLIFKDNIKILGNPTTENLRFSLTAAKEGTTSVGLYALDGKTAYFENKIHQKGINYFNIPVHSLTQGIYILTINNEEGMFTDKMVIVE